MATQETKCQPNPRRAGPGDEPAAGPWHTLVSCTVAAEYRKDRPAVERVTRADVTLSYQSHTESNIFKIVTT